MYILRNCNLIPALTEGTTLTRADLVIDGARITKIAPCGLANEAGAQELDLHGMTVMPGLIDAHIHLRSTHPLGSARYTDPHNPAALALEELLFAQFFLDNGYTAVRVPGDVIGYPAMALRNHINSGRVKGPRIFTCGRIILPTEAGNDGFWAPMTLEADGPMEMRRAVRYELQKGADFIKLYGTGSLVVSGANPNHMIIREDEVREAVESAKMKDTYCAIHCHGDACCEMSARAGVRTIEHASFIEPRTLEYLETCRDAGQGLVLTVSIFGDPALELSGRSEIRDKCFAHLRRIKDYDVLVGWGTDTDLEYYEQDPYAEFRMRSEELGFSNVEILKQATINTARLIGKDDQFGSVKEGKYADLIVIDGNPAEDLTAMYHKPVHVMKNGELIR